jgi:general secretion pathway protein C
MLATLTRKLNDDQSRLHGALARAAGVVTVVLVVLLADRFAALTWSVVPRPSIPVPELPSGVRTVAPQGIGGAVDHTQLAGLHLFGQAQAQQAKPAPEAPVPENMPETRLRLTLRGVFHSTDGDLARVIVAGPDGREEVYSLGASLPGGAQLEEIAPERVILVRDGQRETLTFPVDNRSSIQVNSAPSPDQAAQPVAATATRINATSLAEQYRQTMESDPSALTDIAQVQPFIDQGTFRGFRLRPGRKPALLRQLGLRPGDVVTTIDGVQLDNMSRAMESLRTFAEADQVDVTILRNGRQIPYSYRLN